MKKLLASLLLVLFLPINGLAESYVSIRELYQETRAPWQATYVLKHGDQYAALTKDYPHSVDLVPTVPEVKAFPVLKLKVKPVTLTRGEIKAFGGGYEMMGFLSLKTGGIYPGTPGAELSREFYDEMEWAEDNPLSPQDAEAIFSRLMARYFQVDNFRVRGVAAYGREPHFYGEYKYLGENAATARQNELPRGVYTVVGNQEFYGIPLLDSAWLYNSQGQVYPAIWNEVTILDEDHFILSGCAMEQVGLVYEDVPLLPFSRIRAAYEQYIAKTDGINTVIRISSAELGYRLALAPGDSGSQERDNVYITQPIWILRGYYPAPLLGWSKTDAAETERQQRRLAHSEAMRLGLYGGWLAIDAQTGEVLNGEDLSINYGSSTADIVAWP